MNSLGTGKTKPELSGKFKFPFLAFQGRLYVGVLEIFFNATLLWISLLSWLLFHLSVSQFDKCCSCSLFWGDFWPNSQGSCSSPEMIEGVQVPLEWGNLGKKSSKGRREEFTLPLLPEFPTWCLLSCSTCGSSATSSGEREIGFFLHLQGGLMMSGGQTSPIIPR